jgi:hypothetical protein
MIVVPAEMSAARRYTLTTIALVLGFFAQGASSGEIRRRVAPGRTDEDGWASIWRWLRELQEGKLFRWIRGMTGLSGRDLARHVSAVLAEQSGMSARGVEHEDRIWAGVMATWAR